MKKPIALMLVFFFLFGCAASTVIQSKPPGADICYEEKVLGKTPYRYSSHRAGGTWPMTLKKEGYVDMPVTIAKDKLDIGAIVLGLFFIVPLLWSKTFPPEYSFEMQKLEAKPADRSPSASVAPSSGTAKILTVTWTAANIRSGSGDDYPVVATVKQGDKLTVIGESGEWFNVQAVGGQQGWINSRVVK